MDREAFRENCYDFNETTAAPKIDHHLVKKSSFKRRTEVFPSYIIGKMFRTNKLFVDSVATFCVILFLVRDTYHLRMTCHDSKDIARLYCGFIPDNNIPYNNHNNSRLFSFLYIVFYCNNNLKLCFSLADTAVKKR